MFFIQEKIREIVISVKRELEIQIPDELAFVYLCLSTYFMPKASYVQLRDNITEGSSDGGIDFIYFNEDDGVLNLCQCKYTEENRNQDVKDAFARIEETIHDFKRVHTAKYNAKTRELLQNELDRFDKDNEIIQYNFFSISKFKKDGLLAEIDNMNRTFSSDNISIFDATDISDYLQLLIVKTKRIPDVFKLDIDRARNWLTYEQVDGTKGAFVNVSSNSIKKMHNHCCPGN